MIQEKIICPSCGAENSHYGTCEYCGSSIQPPKGEAGQNGKGVHGIHKVDFDERVLKQYYDKFADETKTIALIELRWWWRDNWEKYCLDNYYRKTVYGYYENNEIKLLREAENGKDAGICLYFVQKGWEEGHVVLAQKGSEEIKFIVDGKLYQSSKKLNKETYINGVTFDKSAYIYIFSKQSLYDFCSAKTLEISGVVEYVVKALQLIARVFYFTFYDNTLFADSPDQLLEF